MSEPRTPGLDTHNANANTNANGSFASSLGNNSITNHVVSSSTTRRVISNHNNNKSNTISPQRMSISPPLPPMYINNNNTAASRSSSQLRSASNNNSIVQSPIIVTTDNHNNNKNNSTTQHPMTTYVDINDNNNNSRNSIQNTEDDDCNSTEKEELQKKQRHQLRRATNYNADEDADVEGEEILDNITMRMQQYRMIPWMFISYFILANALNFTNNRMPDPAEARPLPDLGFELLPKLPIERGTDVCIWILNLLNIFTCWKLYLLWRYDRPLFASLGDCAACNNSGNSSNNDNITTIMRHHDSSTEHTSHSSSSSSSGSGRQPSSRWWNNPVTRFFFCPTITTKVRALGGERPDIFRESFVRFFTSYGAMLYLRSIVIAATILPATNNHCQKPQIIKDWWFNVFLTVVTFGGSSIHCGDLMFSGHMTVASLGICSIWSYCPYVCRYFRPIALSAYLCAWFTIVASRSHYTDDIIIAALLSGMVYMLVFRDGVISVHGSSANRAVRGAPRYILFFLSPTYAAHTITRFFSSLRPMTCDLERRSVSDIKRSSGDSLY